MATSNVYVFHAEPQFYSELLNRLSPYGVSVEKKHRWEDLYVAFPGEALSNCLILNVNLGNIFSLINSGFFKKLKQKKHAHIIALTHDESTCNLIEKHAGGEVQVLPSNILLDRLILNILNQLPVIYTNPGKTRYISTAFGKTPDFSIDDLLDFCHHIGLTGRIIIQQDLKRGHIDLERGKVAGITYQALPPVQALKMMLTLTEATVQVEQRVFDLTDISEFIARKNQSGDLALKDVLIDLFYFMHRHFEHQLPAVVIENAVENIIGEFSGPVLDGEGIYFVYNPEWQEKLKIIGEIDQNTFRRALELYESIFKELSSQGNFNSFRQFLDSLKEIKPVILKVHPFEKILSESQLRTAYQPANTVLN